MKTCKKCLLPETHDTIMFDENGVCSVCNQIEFKKDMINWEERKQMLMELINQYKGKSQYDCIIPYSGGKDSVFQLWYVIRELGLKPLVVTFDHWFYRPLVEENNRKVFKKLGVDVVRFTPNWHVVRELMLESLKRRGDFCWHCHTGIYAHTMRMALRFETPLLIWGETLAEYASWYSYDEFEEVDEKRFNRAMNLGITADDMYEFLGGRVDKRDLIPYAYPEYRDLKKLKCRSICLGNYIEWDTVKQVEIIKRELGWQGHEVEGSPRDYEKMECMFQGVRDYCKYIKRGYGRTNHLCCIDIRNGRMTRQEGEELTNAYDGKRPKSLDVFLEFLELSEEEFYEILKKHEIHPWCFDKNGIEDAKPLYDMEKWDRTIEGVPKLRK